MIYVEKGQWYLLVMTRCKYLTADDRCRIYLNRPKICREYTTDNCEYDGEWSFEKSLRNPRADLGICRGSPSAPAEAAIRQTVDAADRANRDRFDSIGQLSVVDVDSRDFGSRDVGLRIALTVPGIDKPVQKARLDAIGDIADGDAIRNRLINIENENGPAIQPLRGGLRGVHPLDPGSLRGDRRGQAGDLRRDGAQKSRLLLYPGSGRTWWSR